MFERRKAGSRCQAGQALIVFSLALAALCGMAALTIDVGEVYLERSSAQNAADAAALAGVRHLPDAPSQAVSAARQWAQQNGFVDGADGAVVRVTTPYKGDASKIRVDIDTGVAASFARALHIDRFAVSAGATAQVDAGPGLYALLVLHHTKCFAFDNTGSGNVEVHHGGIMINSTCSTGGRHAGSGKVDADVIHYFEEGGFVDVGSGNVTPDPAPVSSRVEDPLKQLTSPTPGAASPTSEGTPANPKLTLVNGSGDKTLLPGTYYGGLKIVGSGNVTLEPGTYIMAGGGLEIDASGNVKGNGLLFYNTNDSAQPVGAGAHGRIKLASSGNFDLSAPTTGAWAHIIFWQDRQNTQTFTHTGSGNVGTGVIYLPEARLDMAGSGNVTGQLQLIVKEFDKSGSGNLELHAGRWVGGGVNQPVSGVTATSHLKG